MPTYANLVLEILQETDKTYKLQEILDFVKDQRQKDGNKKTSEAYVKSTLTKLIRNNVVDEIEENIFKIKNSENETNSESSDCDIDETDFKDKSQAEKFKSNKISLYNIFTKNWLEKHNKNNETTNEENTMQTIALEWNRLKQNQTKFQIWKKSLETGNASPPISKPIKKVSNHNIDVMKLDLDVESISLVSDTLPHPRRSANPIPNSSKSSCLSNTSETNDATIGEQISKQSNIHDTVKSEKNLLEYDTSNKSSNGNTQKKTSAMLNDAKETKGNCKTLKKDDVIEEHGMEEDKTKHEINLTENWECTNILNKSFDLTKLSPFVFSKNCQSILTETYSLCFLRKTTKKESDNLS